MTARKQSQQPQQPTTTTTETDDEVAARQQRLILMFNLVYQYQTERVLATHKTTSIVDHREPLYERRRAEDLRAGDIIWWNNSEVVITRTNVYDAVATRDPILLIHYRSRLVAFNARMLRQQVVLARVRSAQPVDHGCDETQRALDTLLDASARNQFWDEVIAQMLADDNNLDDQAAHVIWRNPRIARLPLDQMPYDPNAYDETTPAPASPDDAPDDDTSRNR